MHKCTLIFPVHRKYIYLGRKKQKYGAGLYNGWGGKHEDHDNSLLATAIREFRQETGGATFDPTDLELMAVIEFYKGGVLIFECWVYFLSRWQGELGETAEMGEGHPYPISRLPLEEMMPGDKKWLPLICDPNREEILEAKVFYSEDMQEVLDFQVEP